eukprot:7228565-Pyramimonas_sp.AAC.1
MRITGVPQVLAVQLRRGSEARGRRAGGRATETARAPPDAVGRCGLAQMGGLWILAITRLCVARTMGGSSRLTTTSHRA